jgi:hypothetical protein
MKTDKKYLGTIHTSRAIDEYWQVRIQSKSETTFQFQLERITPSGSKTYVIKSSDIPNQITRTL